VGEDPRRTDRTNELIAELRARVRSLENQLRQERAEGRENRRIIALLTSRTPELPAAPREPAGSTQPERRNRRRYSSWWKERFGAAMVGVIAAFAVLASSGEENPIRVAEAPPSEAREEQARVPTTPANTEPAPAASEPVPVRPTDPVR
jgi:hypothetical protein